MIKRLQRSQYYRASQRIIAPSVRLHHLRQYCSDVEIDASPIMWSSYMGMRMTGVYDNKSSIAIRGMLKSLFRIEREYDYDYIGVCLDHPVNFRKEKNPQYKAQRKPMEKELSKQFDMLEDALECTGMLPLIKEGYEADDLIATYCRKAEENGHQVIVISPDKDMGQLVSSNVELVSVTAKKKKYDRNNIIKLWGVEPQQVPHVQALCGDRIDNIGNVPGVGPVKAASLIRQFGTIEQVLARTDEIKDVYLRETIRSHSKVIEKNIEMTKLITDIPDVPPLHQLKKKLPEKEKAIKYLEEFNLGDIGRYICQHFFRKNEGEKKNVGEDEIIGNTSQSDEATDQIQSTEPVFRNIVLTSDMPSEDRRAVIESAFEGVTVVNDKASAEKVLATLYKYPDRYHAWDTEVIDIDLKAVSPVGHGTVICATLYLGPDVDFGNGPRVWIDNLDESEGTLLFFKEYLENSRYLKVWHNYGFDRHVIYNHGIDVMGFGGDTMHMARLWDSSRVVKGYSLESLSRDILDARVPKRGMMKRFGVYRLRADGEPVKVPVLPPLETLQRDASTVLSWVDYATLDAEATWFLREALHRKLVDMDLEPNVSTMWDYYQHNWLPFGELLTDMEREGIHVNLDHLNAALPKALEEKINAEKVFLDWAETMCPGCGSMNPGSDIQKRQLFFAPCRNLKTRAPLPVAKVFKKPNIHGIIVEGKKKAKKEIDFTINGLGIPPAGYTKSGWPSVSGPTFRKLITKGTQGISILEKYMTKKGYDAEEATAAIEALLEANTVETLITTFLQPLPTYADENHRIHCALNINTDTGRLSSRKPNLQNQPARDKDRFRIRQAFGAKEGCSMIVADYGQLELRLLAHVTQCKSMIDAFRSGGDFHSRTAIGMYPHIQQAVDAGEVLLEWDSTKGNAPAPLIKDVYGSERKKAKTLNFSIAYGKTIHGFAKDWGVSLGEAQDTLDKWYNDRPEVRDWQNAMIAYAKETGYTRTLMGRYRKLENINSRKEGLAKHAERAAINTPLQGGAADIMVCAMNKLHRNKRFRELGWKQLLQIHDEIICEGPIETQDEAMRCVVSIMENPLEKPLSVDLVVDACLASNWYDAK